VAERRPDRSGFPVPALQLSYTPSCPARPCLPCRSGPGGGRWLLRCDNGWGQVTFAVSSWFPYLLAYQLLISFPYLFENKASVHSLAQPKRTRRSALCSECHPTASSATLRRPPAQGRGLPSHRLAGDARISEPAVDSGRCVAGSDPARPPGRPPPGPGLAAERSRWLADDLEKTTGSVCVGRSPRL